MKVISLLRPGEHFNENWRSNSSMGGRSLVLGWGNLQLALVPKLLGQLPEDLIQARTRLAREKGLLAVDRSSSYLWCVNWNSWNTTKTFSQVAMGLL
jgi:hypothetical protein